MLQDNHTATQWDTLWKRKHESLVNDSVRKNICEKTSLGYFNAYCCIVYLAKNLWRFNCKIFMWHDLTFNRHIDVKFQKVVEKKSQQGSFKISEFNLLEYLRVGWKCKYYDRVMTKSYDYNILSFCFWTATFQSWRF